MYVKLDTEIQIDLVSKAISKAGSERKFGKALKISNGMIYYYKHAFHRLPEERFRKILHFLGLKESDFDFELIDSKEYRSKGGKAVYAKYKKSGRFEEIHTKMRAASSKKMKRWHKQMKKQNKQAYFELQYSRFKKISGYSIKTKKGHLVRNALEKDVADLLFDTNLDYEYEQYVVANGKVYFPDYIFGKTIIECTSWKGVQKAYLLSVKINNFEKEGFIVWVVIPKRLASFYKPIQKNIIYLEELMEDKAIRNKIFDC
jgi:hypothetical protein